MLFLRRPKQFRRLLLQLSCYKTKATYSEGRLDFLSFWNAPLVRLRDEGVSQLAGKQKASNVWSDDHNTKESHITQRDFFQLSKKWQIKSHFNYRWLSFER